MTEVKTATQVFERADPFVKTVCDVVRRNGGHVHRIQVMRKGSIIFHAQLEDGQLVSVEMLPYSSTHMLSLAGNPHTPWDVANSILSAYAY